MSGIVGRAAKQGRRGGPAMSAEVAAMVMYLESIAHWLENQTAFGVAALAGAALALMGARLALVWLVIATLGAFLLQPLGVAIADLPWWIHAALMALFAAAIVELVVVVIGGRNAAPNFWATTVATAATFLLLAPLQAVRIVSLAAAVGRRALRSMRLT